MSGWSDPALVCVGHRLWTTPQTSTSQPHAANTPLQFKCPFFYFKPDVQWTSEAARFFFSVSCQAFRRPGAAIWLFVEMSSNSTLGALLNWFHLLLTLGLASDLPATPPKICPPPSPATHTLPFLPSGAENGGGFQPVCGI